MRYEYLNLTYFRGLKLDPAFAAFSHTDGSSSSGLSMASRLYENSTSFGRRHKNLRRPRESPDVDVRISDIDIISDDDIKLRR